MLPPRELCVSAALLGHFHPQTYHLHADVSTLCEGRGGSVRGKVDGLVKSTGKIRTLDSSGCSLPTVRSCCHVRMGLKSEVGSRRQSFKLEGAHM